jgi:type II secretory pathway predicted ATPase ExeA
MYTTFFGFRELPFPLTNDLHFFHSTPALQKAEADIVTALRERKGLILLTGEPGTGKTTLLRRLSRVLATQAAMISLPFSAVTFDDILTFLCGYFSLAPSSNDPFTKVLAIQEHLRLMTNQGVGAVVCIDEAQNLHKETLDRLRLLLHLKDPQGRLLQIILAGHTSLQTKLAQPDLRHLQQYVTVHCHLQPLSPTEVRAFILHRLAVAGCDRRDLFSRVAIERIAEYSQRVPRLINVICDNALIIAYMAGKRTVPREIIEEVAQNLHLDSTLPASVAQAPQEIVLHKTSVAGSVKKPQGENRTWPHNLLWTSVGIFFAWLSSTPQGIGGPFTTFFSTASRVTILQPSTPSAIGPVSPITVSLKNQLEQQREGEQTNETQPAGEFSPVPTTTPRQEQTPHSSAGPAEQPASPVTPVEDTTSNTNIPTAERAPVLTEKQPPSPPVTKTLPAASSPVPQATQAPVAHRAEASKERPSSPAPMTSSSPRSSPAQIVTRAPQHSNKPHQAVQVQTAPSRRTTIEARAALRRLGLSPTREALFRAVTAGNQRQVKLLLAARVPIEAADRHGWTALMVAVRDHHPEIVRLLLTRGANANATNTEGETALIHAADNGSPVVIQLLLDHGARINAKSNLGWTALMYATVKGHRGTVEALLSRGANPKVKDNEGRTASMYAARQSNETAGKALLQKRSTKQKRVGRLDGERLELVKQHEYREIASLLKQAETRQ